MPYFCVICNEEIEGEIPAALCVGEGGPLHHKCIPEAIFQLRGYYPSDEENEKEEDESKLHERSLIANARW